MKFLFIDTSSKYLNISIIADDKIVYNYSEFVLNDMASKIIPAINDGFRNIDFEISDIDCIFIVNGPGSFTGVRIGVTVAKTLAWALKTKIIPLSSLEFLATHHTTKSYVVPMIDARRGNVFAGIYDNSLNNIFKDKLVSYEQLSKMINEDYEQVSYDFDNVVKPKVDVLRIIHKHINDSPVNPHLVNPNYLKLTEAEEKLNDKISN